AFVAAKVDVIVTANSAATSAARQRTDTIPIVMVSVGDAVLSGFVKSLSRPGANVTGQSFMGVELNQKGFELLVEALPSVKRVTILYDPDLAVRQSPSFQHVIDAGKPKGVEVEILAVKRASDLEASLAAPGGPRPAALDVFAMSIFEQPAIAAVAFKH